MKNLLDPKILAELKQEPISHEKIGAFLEANKKMTAAQLCKLLDVDPQLYYNWKSRSKRVIEGAGVLKVAPTGEGKKSYSAIDKLNLVKLYANLQNEERTEFLRKYGLYDSDFARWQEKADEAALAALSTRKPRRDKKSEEQLEVERLKAELRGQEKTIAKLSAIVVAQKKIADFLSEDE